MFVSSAKSTKSASLEELHTLTYKNITDKNRTLGPLACTFLSVFFLSVHILSVFRMGPKFFQIFAPSLIKTVDYYKVLLLMFIGI